METVEKMKKVTGVKAPSRSQLSGASGSGGPPRVRRLEDKSGGGSSGSSSRSGSSSHHHHGHHHNPPTIVAASSVRTVPAEQPAAESATPSRLNMWANIRDRIFKGGAPEVTQIVFI
jgi:hypothetical protein